MSKLHIADDQLDGYLYGWCGRGGVALPPAVFEAAPPPMRCALCARDWFPHGQPEWHHKQAVAQLPNIEVTARIA